MWQQGPACCYWEVGKVMPTGHTDSIRPSPWHPVNLSCCQNGGGWVSKAAELTPEPLFIVYICVWSYIKHRCYVCSICKCIYVPVCVCIRVCKPLLSPASLVSLDSSLLMITQHPEHMLAQAWCFHPASPRTDPEIQREGRRRWIRVLGNQMAGFQNVLCSCNLVPCAWQESAFSIFYGKRN